MENASPNILPCFDTTLQNNLKEFNREELEARILQLESHNYQLKNILAKLEPTSNGKSSNKLKKKIKEFDFSKHSKRHILLQFLYLGWDRQGFTVQDNCTNTVEYFLFDALLKIKLIETREISNYHRCGRTDKGVSAFHQVVSITIRSNFKSSADNQVDTRPLCEEINYPKLLNTVLPLDIRVIAWSPIKDEFSARFDCSARTYKYFFPRGSLDLKAMNQAGQHLVGEHDFRNFCKMDVGNGVIHYMRRISRISIEQLDRSPAEETSNLFGGMEEDSIENSTCHSDYDMCVATISGKAFLWHQIRAIMTILILVGERNESPDIVKQLLDVTNVPRKPVYSLASEVGLNLYDTEYDDNVDWCYEHENIFRVIAQMQAIWAQNSTKTAMIKHILKDLTSIYTSKFSHEIPLPENQVRSCIQESVLNKLSSTKDSEVSCYKTLLERPTCQSLEERVSHLVKKRRLSKSALDEIMKKQS